MNVCWTMLRMSLSMKVYPIQNSNTILPIILNSCVEWRRIGIFSPWCVDAFMYFQFCLEYVLVYGKKSPKLQNHTQNIPTYYGFFVAVMILIIFKILFVRRLKILKQTWDLIVRNYVMIIDRCPFSVSWQMLWTEKTRFRTNVVYLTSWFLVSLIPVLIWTGP